MLPDPCSGATHVGCLSTPRPHTRNQEVMNIQLPQHIDSTMLTCARSCMRKYHDEFILGLRPAGISVDLHAGACFATAMEVFRRSFWKDKRPHDEALQRAHAAFMIEWGDFEIPPFKKTAKTKDNMWRAVEDYIAQFPPLTDHIQPYFANGEPTFEFTFAIPLEPATNVPPEQGHGQFPLHPSGDPFIYCGRFDMLGAYQTRPAVVDDKTTGRSISTGWSDQWNLRNQFIGYTWACRKSGIDLDTVVARGIAIQVREIKFGEAIKVYSEDLRAKWLEQLRRDMWRIRRSWDEQYFDYNFGDTCTAYGQCIFMDRCRSNNPDAWLPEFQVRHWNPLVKNPVSEKAA